MPKLTESEARFLLKFSLQQIPASILNDLKRSHDKSIPAYERAVDIIMEHFAKGKHEVWRPDPDERMSFNSMKKG